MTGWKGPRCDRHLHLVQASVSKQLARHASMDTTMIYVHEADRMSDPVEDHIFYEDEE